MTKAQLIELLKIELTGGDPMLKNEAKYHDEVLALHIGTVFNSLVSTITDSFLIEQYSVNYNNIPVLQDSTLNLFYSDIPTTILTTKYFSGIRNVSPATSPQSSFFKRKNFSHQVYSALEVNNITTLAYHVDGQRIVYDKINPQITGVNINLLVPFDEIADDDNITMPDGKDSDVFQMVLAQLMPQKQTPQSYNSDNNSNT